MKTSYIAPCTKTRMIETCYILCGSVTGSSDGNSIVKEEEETMGVKRNSYSNYSMKWDNWE